MTSATGHRCRFSHNCSGKCSCINRCTGVLNLFARNCSTSESPLPSSPGEFQGGNDGAEVNEAKLNAYEGDDEIPMEGADYSKLPPYDDSVYPEEDDGDYVDEDPPTDPEEKLLYSPSDE
ncbi:hypothetical protein KP509_14G098200 [Ceratopteris richardii]|nr:hypothetical protein KP509_14G098200 [Ceratopteris richardii]